MRTGDEHTASGRILNGKDIDRTRRTLHAGTVRDALTQLLARATRDDE